MFKRVFGVSLMCISALCGLFMLIYGKALFWCAVVATKLEVAVQGGVYQGLAWCVLILGLWVGSIIYGYGVIDKKYKAKIKELRKEIDKEMQKEIDKIKIG